MDEYNRDEFNAEAENTSDAVNEVEEETENARRILAESEEPVSLKPKEKSSALSGLFDLVSIFASAAIIVAIAFVFFFRTVGVDGKSMYPTLHDRDRLILSAFITKPEYGDIVVTCQPSAYSYIESTLVKRVIATEGQTVDIDFTKGIVYVDGKALDEPYVNEPTYDDESFSGPVTVPEGYVFVMGDNRNASTDSRDYRVGFIREDYIMGKALFRIAPLGKFKLERY